jgi:polar amino acid transport system substrate-binding protein
LLAQIRHLTFRQVTCAFALVTIAGVAGCGSSQSSSTSSTSAAQSHAATTKVASQVPSQFRHGITLAVMSAGPPFSYEAGNTLTGTDPTLARALAQVLGVPVKLVPGSFADELLGVQEGRFDGMAAVNFTLPRLRLYDFATYVQDGYSFGEVAGGPRIGNSQLDVCGQTVAVDAGDQNIAILERWSGECTTHGKATIKVITFPNYAGAEQAVQSGRAGLVSFAVSNLSVLLHSTTSGAQWKIVGPVYNHVVAGFAFKKGDGLAGAFAMGLNELIRNGTYSAIMQKFLSNHNEVQQSQVNPASLATTS